MISGIVRAMMADNTSAELEPTIFSATITPHRSLGGTGFLVLMLAFGGASFVHRHGLSDDGRLAGIRLFRPRRRAALLGDPDQQPPRRGIRASHRHAVGAHRAQGQPPRQSPRMGAQPALGQARQAKSSRISASPGCFWSCATSSSRSPTFSPRHERADFAIALDPRSERSQTRARCARCWHNQKSGGCQPPARPRLSSMIATMPNPPSPTAFPSSIR